MTTIAAMFEHIMERNNITPSFAAELVNMLLQATRKQSLSTPFATNHGPQTPPTSAETSPELRSLCSSPETTLYSTSLSPSDNDPILYPVELRGISPAGSESDDLDASLAMASPDSPYVPLSQTGMDTSMSNQTCGDCFSTNTFRTTGSVAQIDVCSECHSTNILYPSAGHFGPVELGDIGRLVDEAELVFEDVDKLFNF